MKVRSSLIIFSIFTLLLAFSMGCSKSEDVGIESSSTLQPTGTVQGRLTDRVTNQPIVGAVIDIMGKTATTNENGQFKIEGLPATEDALNGTVTGSYQVTINLKNVTSPVNMKDPNTKPRYPDYVLACISVVYTSLNDTEGYNPGGGSGSNHDTPVTGLAATADFKVGKLAANIKGVVAYEKNLQPVGSGWTVQLISKGSNQTGTGSTGNIAGTTTTDENGAFTFNNVESLQDFTIIATNSDNTYYGMKDVTAPADGGTLVLSIQTTDPALQAVLVSSIDDQAPFITSVTPEDGSDLSPSSPVEVKFTFSEPIKSDAYSQCLTSSCNGLYSDVQVNYMGNKAGNIAHSIAWSSDMKTLTVTIPTLAPASKYKVDISSAVGKLKDAEGNTARASGKEVVNFTTNGAVLAGAPTISLVNADGLNWNGCPTIDWLPVSGAKSYNVYRQINHVWGSTVNPGAFELIANTTQSEYRECVSFVENDNIKLTYTYIVKAVNADYLESDASNAVTAQDKVGPGLVAQSLVIMDMDGDGNCDTIVVSFDEPMDEASVEDLNTATYKYYLGGTENATLTATGAVYNPATYSVTLTFPDTHACGEFMNDPPGNNDETLTVSGVKDVAGNAIRTNADTYHQSTGNVD
jgi:hypothetical protein